VDINMNDQRLIEDYLPIEAISAEASREKSVRKGHISTLHLWWARRPLVACRAAVYGALVPADRWVKEVELKSGPADSAKAAKVKNGKKKGLNRKAAKEFVTKLCRYPKIDPKAPADIKIKRETESAIVEAQRHILEAHAERLTGELAEARQTGKSPAWADEFKFAGTKVTYEDIVAGRAPRPRVLDMFAGGGSIPPEALRLGCEAYAPDLNPVAHIIELCTLVYPQNYGKPDPTARGMTGPKNDHGETTWGGLAAEVRYWGNWVLDRVRKEIGDLYPPIADPAVWNTPPEIAFDRETSQWNVTKAGKLKRGVKPEDLQTCPTETASLLPSDEEEEGTSGSAKIPPPPGFLEPVAYLWTRTVRCKNPSCGATVPLVKQTWMRKKKGDFVALKLIATRSSRSVTFSVVQSTSETGLGFDPDIGSKGGNATCPFCGSVSDADYVKKEGIAGRLGDQQMCTACVKRGLNGKVYVTADTKTPDEVGLRSRLEELCRGHALSVPNEPIVNDAKKALFCVLYGLVNWSRIFSSRQLLSLTSFAAAIRSAEAETSRIMDQKRSESVVVLLASMLDRLADFSSTICVWNSMEGERTAHTFGRQALPMSWDYSEGAPFNGANAGWPTALERVIPAIESIDVAKAGVVVRGTATSLPWESDSIDAIVTDPPYYDNVPYADISDFFYVWLKRTIGHIHADHFGGQGTPKKQEVVADATRHGGDRKKAEAAYERMMAGSLQEAYRTLKPGGTLSMVYAHKTTLGWSTLVRHFVIESPWS
jgi:putative DNA methylase